MGFFDRIKSGLTKTRKAMASSLGSVFSFSEIDDDFYDELEECLILGDLGVNTAVKAVDALRARVKAERLKSAEDVKAALREEIGQFLRRADTPRQRRPEGAELLDVYAGFPVRHDAGRKEAGMRKTEMQARARAERLAALRV